MKGAILAGALALAAAGAGAHGAEAEAERQLAQTLAESATRAAVAHRGVTVCRQLQVGIAERDWIRGEVVDVRGDIIAVRIEDAGRFPHILKEIPVVPDAVLRDPPILWTPCV